MGYTHFDGISIGSTGLAVGTATAGESVVITSAGAFQTTAGTTVIGSSGSIRVSSVPLSVSVVCLGSSTAAETYYTVAPVAGTVSGYVSWPVSAGTGRAVTVKVGSAGAELLQMSALGVSGTQGAVSTLSNTSGTTTITAGASMSIALASCATAQPLTTVVLYVTPSA